MPSARHKPEEESWLVIGERGDGTRFVLFSRGTEAKARHLADRLGEHLEDCQRITVEKLQYYRRSRVAAGTITEAERGAGSACPAEAAG